MDCYGCHIFLTSLINTIITTNAIVIEFEVFGMKEKRKENLMRRFKSKQFDVD